MQCRICLEEANPEEMISPCRCSGSAAFIHRNCLQQYIHHYPDGVCRVCKTSFYRSTSIGETLVMCFLVSFFMTLVISSSLNGMVQFGLLITCIASIGLYSSCQMFDAVFCMQFVGLTLVPLLISNVSSMMTYLGLVILSTMIYFFLSYIPIEYIFTLLFIALGSVYAGMVLVSLLMVDFYGFIVMLTMFGMFLRVWARYHPPLWMPIH